MRLKVLGRWMQVDYVPDFDPDDQITAEEGIAAHIWSYQEETGAAPLTEEDCAELGRQLLMRVLSEFRPDLVIHGEYPLDTD